MGQLLWKTVWQFLKKLNLELSYDPAIGLKVQENWKHVSPKNLSMNAHRSIIHKSQNMETTQMFISRWMYKQNVGYIHAMEYYSNIQWNTVPTHVRIRMNLANTLLCERNQTHKTTHWTILFIRNVQNRQMHRDRTQISGSQRLKGGNGEWLLKGLGFLFGATKCSRISQGLWPYNLVTIVKTLNCRFKYSEIYGMWIRSQFLYTIY